MLITAFPLTWCPPSQERTPINKRASASYRAGFAKARDDLLDELRLFGADHVVISSNIPLRKDGLPYANFKEPTDPGISVYFRIKKQSYAISCDAWDKAKDNLGAIGKYVAALRMICNCRVSSVFPFIANHMIKDYVLKQPEQSKSKKKSDSSSKNSKHESQQRTKTKTRTQTSNPDWRQILGVTCDANFFEVKAAYYAAARLYHPDSGSCPNLEVMKTINLAFEQAKVEYRK